MRKKILLSLSIILIAVNYTKAQDSLKTFGFMYMQPNYGVEENFPIIYVVNGSGAMDKGVKPGDIVTAVEGVPVLNFTSVSLATAIDKAKQRGQLQITLARAAEPLVLKVKTIARYTQLDCKDCKQDEDYFRDNIIGFTYKGQIKNNKLNGKGTILYYWNNCPVKVKNSVRIKKIEAVFTDNKPGQGIYYYADESGFVGAIPNFNVNAPFDNNWPTGAGKFENAEGTIMEGVFDARGNKTGLFRFNKENGDKYECNYVNNVAVSRKETVNTNGAPLKKLAAVATPTDLVPYQFYAGGNRDNKALWGYKNKAGVVFIKPINMEPRLFKNNYCVLVKDKKLGLMDATGTIIIEPADYFLLSDVEGSFVTLRNFKTGCAVRNIYDSTIIDITNGMTKMEKDKSYNKEFDGFEYETLTTTAPNIFLVKKIPGGKTDFLSREENTRYGLINAKDSMLIPFTYKGIDEPGEGFLRVEDMNGKEGLINNAGKWAVMPGKYDGMGRMVEGMAFVSINGKYGYINKEGKEIHPCTLEDATDFKNGYARVKAGGKYYFIDKAAKASLQGHPFKYLYEGKNNLFIATKQNNKPDLLVNAKGESQLKTEAEQVVFTTTGYAYVAAGKVVINNGKEIKLPYDSITKIAAYPNGMLMLTQTKKNSYNDSYHLDWVVDNTGKLIVESGKSGKNFEYDTKLNLLKKVTILTRSIQFICYLDDKGKDYLEMGK